MNQSIYKIYEQGRITEETALEASPKPNKWPSSCGAGSKDAHRWCFNSFAAVRTHDYLFVADYLTLKAISFNP